MSIQETNVARIGFDLRGLLALTSVAAFVAMASKVDLGTAVVLGAIFSASALMAHVYPVGSPSRHRAMGLMFVIGIVIACFAIAIQYLIFGNLQLQLGTTLAVCIAIGIGAASVYKPTCWRWSKRILISAILILVCYFTAYSVFCRNSIYLSLRHDVYYKPRFTFTRSDSAFGQNWILNQLRVAVGLTGMYGIDFQSELTAADLNGLFNAGSVGFVRFTKCTVDLPQESLPESKLVGLQFMSCKLRGKSLGALAAASNSTFIDLEECQVDSFKGLSAATKVQWIGIQRIPITDELIDEILKLPVLKGLSLDPDSLSENQFERIRAERNGLIINYRQ